MKLSPFFYNKKFNIFLGCVFAIYVLCASKYIGQKDSIFYSNFYKLILLIGVLIIYPYHKQAGVILLIIVMITHFPMFREKFADIMTSSQNKESNYDITIEKRKKIDEKISKEQPRFDLLKDEGIITPLEQSVISDIQRQFDDQIDMITTDDFDKIASYTDEGDPINAGLLPKTITKSSIDYDQLILAGKIINF